MNTNNSLNKIIGVTVILILLFSSIVGAISTTKMLNDRDYSHTVFAGAGMTQACGHCDGWNENIYNASISGDYDFEYVSMIVFDQEGSVLNWEALYWDDIYSISTYPTTIFDGDYQR